MPIPVPVLETLCCGAGRVGAVVVPVPLGGDVRAHTP